MTSSEEIRNLKDAHDIIYRAFDAQLEWWVFIPFIGIHRIIRRQKLIRIGAYLLQRALEI